MYSHLQSRQTKYREGLECKYGACNDCNKPNLFIGNVFCLDLHYCLHAIMHDNDQGYFQNIFKKNREKEVKKKTKKQTKHC